MYRSHRGFVIGSKMSIKNINLNNVVIKSTKGIEIFEAENISLKNAEIYSTKLNRLVFVENSSRILFNGLKYSVNPELLISVSGDKTNLINFSNTLIDKSKIKYSNKASDLSVEIK